MAIERLWRDHFNQKAKAMKKSISFLATLALLAPCWPVLTNAATQVYDLKADWSDTQNPNGPWSYREGENLLADTPFPWVGAGYSSIWPALAIAWPLVVPSIERVSGAVKAYDGFFAYLSTGVIEDSDLLMFPGNDGNILWTAPESGSIDISGSAWSADELDICGFAGGGPVASWTLTHNGSSLSGGGIWSSLCLSSNPRGAPDDFSSGSGGTAALHNISVAAGDQIVLAFGLGVPVGVNFTITLTPDSVDPVAAIEDLAMTVFEMNLQNGIENSLDSKLDAALNALGDANVNNDGAACNSLAAFIGSVEAQRGKKITNAQADQLIASAQQIQTSLNCGN